MVEVAAGAGVGAFGGTDVCAGGASIMGIGIVSRTNTLRDRMMAVVGLR